MEGSTRVGFTYEKTGSLDYCMLILNREVDERLRRDSLPLPFFRSEMDANI